jgi:thiosulfate/3-mercaptopyruvate sulfurtransferase
MARVACALEYGGVKNVAILDGGHNQWVRENRVISHESDKPTSKIYSGQIDRKVFVKKEYVLDHLGKVLMVDVREPDFFVGRKKTSLVERAGHIPGAVNLPTSRAFASDGKFKPVKELARIAAEVVGEDLSREIVTYCDTGKCCPTWRFLLKELLGYRNTYLYDGSIQEWTRDPTSPME